jgi:hypothetical protein
MKKGMRERVSGGDECISVFSITTGSIPLLVDY